MKSKHLQSIAWGLSGLVLVLAFVAWGQGMRWRVDSISTYSLFPLFGLIAFSLMWAHYATAGLRKYLKADGTVLKRYFEVTSLAVLAAILLHPGLLIWQLWRDGLGLPPDSLKAYAGPLYGAVVLGLVALILFMAYEFRRKYSDRTWWKYIQYMSDFAMFLILVHALRLGSHLQAGWFRSVWFFYGVSLAGLLLYMYWPKANKTP